MTPKSVMKTELELLDEEAFAVPERLSAEDCLDQIGTDWRWPSAPSDWEDEG